MDDFLKEKQAEQNQSELSEQIPGKTPINQARSVDAQKINLNDYSTLPPGTKITEIRNRKEGL